MTVAPAAGEVELDGGPGVSPSPTCPRRCARRYAFRVGATSEAWRVAPTSVGTDSCTLTSVCNVEVLDQDSGRQDGMVSVSNVRPSQLEAVPPPEAQLSQSAMYRVQM